jgi:type IV pilus assembly protein PilC
VRESSWYNGGMPGTALPLSALVDLCRALRHNLAAGLTLANVFRQQSKRGPSAIRAVAGDIARHLGKGRDLEHALESHRNRFPPLFIELAIVGERSGNLPEVFAELEKYFQLRQRLARQLRAQLAWPVTQYVLGVLVITLMMLILSMFGSSFDPLGFGLTGAGGALLFLILVVAFTGLLIGGVVLIRRRPGIEGWLLHRPVVGSCLMALALQRFSVALRLTTETGMDIKEAVRLSLRATGNVAFIEGNETVLRSLEQGEELAPSLKRVQLFPDEYLNILETAEESGSLDEVLRQQSEYYAEESERRMTMLTKLIGTCIWVLIGGLLVFVIFRLALSYINALNQPFGA